MLTAVHVLALRLPLPARPVVVDGGSVVVVVAYRLVDCVVVSVSVIVVRGGDGRWW